MATQYAKADARNPQANGSYKSGTAPGAGDVAIFADGDTPIDTNLGWSAVDLLKFIVGPAKGGDFGSDIAPLEIVVNQTGTGQLQIFGRGQRYYISGGGASNVIHQIQFSPSAGGQLILISCTNADMHLEAGSSIIETTVTLGDVVISGTHFAHIKPHASDVIALLVVGDESRCQLERDYTTARCTGGTLIHDLVEPSGVAGGTLEVYAGTLVMVRGGVGTLNGYGGEIDCTQMKEDITPAAGTMYPGVVIRRLRNGPQLILSSVTIKGRGPKYIDV